MANYSGKLFVSSTGATWPGWIDDDPNDKDREKITEAYGVALSDEAWAGLKDAVSRLAMSLGQEAEAVAAKEARKRLNAVVKASAILQAKIDIADSDEMDRAATRRANDRWEEIFCPDATFEQSIAELHTLLTHYLEDGKERAEIMAAIAARFPRPDPANDFVDALNRYRNSVSAVVAGLGREEKVKVGSAVDGFIMELSNWALHHGYPFGAAQGDDVDHSPTSQFVLLVQKLLQLAPEEHRPTKLLDSSMTDRINRTRREHNWRDPVRPEKPNVLTAVPAGKSVR